MALITCPECGRQVSDAAQVCPNCGYPLAKKKDTRIVIKIDRNTSNGLASVTIYDLTNHRKIGEVHQGSMVEYECEKSVEVGFLCGTHNLQRTVDPGKRYLVTWSYGIFGGSRIAACTEVDVVDS